MDTAKVAGLRTLHFESLDQVMAEAERVAEAERGGRLRCLGNWTVGQTLGHLACWMEYCYTGVPLKVPFYVRWLLRLRKRKFLYAPMPPGLKIPTVKGGTLATEVVPLEAALVQLRKAATRLQAEAPTLPHPIFGALKHDEWIALHLRHAELHLGFMVC